MKRFFKLIFSISLLLFVIFSCTKEITEDIFNFKENFFTVQVSADKNAVELQELVNFTLKLQENELPSVYTLDFSTNREGTFRFDSSTFESGQSTTIDAGVHEFSYFPTDEGIHKLSFTVTNANENPRSLTDTFSISVGDVSDLETGFSLVITSSPEEIEVGDLVTINLNIIEEADVPDTATYTIDFGASATGTFVFEGGNYTGESQVVVEETALTFQFTPEEIIEYDLKFSVTSQFDETNICESAIFTVEAASTEIPVITLNGENPLTLTVGDEYVETATVTDDVDTNIEIVFGGNFDGTTNTAGEFTRTYNATDSDDNQAEEQTRIINIISEDDVTPPLITLLGENPLELIVGSDYVEPGAIAIDAVDGDISTQIEITGLVNVNIIGDYEIAYNVSDSSGNAAEEVIRIVSVLSVPDTEAPIINLSGENPLELIVGSDYVEQGATASDNVDGDITSEIEITGSADVDAIGNYEIAYNVSDSAGNAAEEVIRIVRVVAAPIYVTEVNIKATQSFSNCQSVSNLGGLTLNDIGSQRQIVACILPIDATNQNVIYESTNPLVASIEENTGLLTTISEGVTTITVITEDGRFTDSIDVEVRIPITTLQIEELQIDTINVGDTLQLNANFEPIDATPNLVWTSNDEDIAIVDSNGLLTAMNPGEVIITLTDDDGDLSSMVGITVIQDNTAPIAKLTVSPPSGILNETLFTFDASESSDMDGDLLTYSYSSHSGTSSSVSTIFSGSTTRNVIMTVTVTDSKGATDTATVTVTVSPPPNANPVANASVSATNGTTSTSFTFDASASSDSDGDTLSYSWSESGVVFSTDEIVSQTFNVAGNYDILLTVTDENGGVDTDSVSINVCSGIEQCTETDFVWCPRVCACVPESVVFTAGCYE